GYLTQKDQLFPHLCVAQNVLFGLDPQRRHTERDWIARLRHHLGLDAFWEAPVRLLSGGQARRVALARMLARKPRLVLLDEPFTGLDRHIVRELLQVLLEWQAELRFSLLAVDHQAEVLERMCPTVLVLERGRVLQQGSWAQLRAQPASPLLAQLLAPYGPADCAVGNVPSSPG
ncbi:MAG TPA: ATP-binding cassette domain-containing protein, partial [Acidiferrobacteraceae bacterium]|nr:ATP-binding cassette domain-containing protein [Acidiferrobacteraceae bacterium]